MTPPWSGPSGCTAALGRGNDARQWHTLIDKVFPPKTLALAFASVTRKDRAAGVDGITTQAMRQREAEELPVIQRLLREDRYEPQPVRRVWIEKPGSREKRPLGIPTVRDRIVQCALRTVIEPIFERDFSTHSYGFRPGRSARAAVARVEEQLEAGKTWVVDADIKGYFDNILIQCHTEAEALAALAEVQKWMAEAGLTLHPEKTRVVDATGKGGFEFLGWHFERGYKWPREKSIRKLKDSVRAKTKRNNGHDLRTIIKRVNPTTRGWGTYFRGGVRNVPERLDQWIRMRLRSILRHPDP